MPEIYYKNQNRKVTLKKLKEFAKRIENTLVEENREEIVEEYQEFLGELADEDPEFSGWYVAEVPVIEEVQSLLRDGEVLVKIQMVHDGILVWLVDAESDNRVKVACQPTLESIAFPNCAKRIAVAVIGFEDIVLVFTCTDERIPGEGEFALSTCRWNFGVFALGGDADG